jgi:peptide deformylase
MILNVLKMSNPAELKILHRKCVDVTDFNEDLQSFCRDMVETMFAADGVGLAAPQVGRNINMFVMRTLRGLAENTREHIVLVNPYTVIEVGDGGVAQEGCLSVPGLWGDVKRFDHVGVVYWTPEGERRGVEYKSFQARIYQHEYDHLQGKLFLERATKFYKPKSKP